MQTDLFPDLVPFTEAERRVIAEAREIMARYARKGPLISDWRALEDYAVTAFAGERVEVFRVLFLDRKNRLIEDVAMHRGTIDHVAAYPAEIARKALQLDASAAIIAHNHPSGDPSPSEADKTMSRKVREALEVFSIILHDSVIVGGATVYSMRAHGDF